MGEIKHQLTEDINHPEHQAEIPELIVGFVAAVVAISLALVSTSRLPGQRSSDHIRRAGHMAGA